MRDNCCTAALRSRSRLADRRLAYVDCCVKQNINTAKLQQAASIINNSKFEQIPANNETTAAQKI